MYNSMSGDDLTRKRAVNRRILASALLLALTFVVLLAAFLGGAFSMAKADCVPDMPEWNCRQTTWFGLFTSKQVARNPVLDEEYWGYSVYERGTELRTGSNITAALLGTGTALEVLIFFWGVLSRFSAKTGHTSRGVVAVMLVSAPVFLVVGTVVWLGWCHPLTKKADLGHDWLEPYNRSISVGWSSMLCIIAWFLSVGASVLVYRWFFQNPLPDPALQPVGQREEPRLPSAYGQLTADEVAQKRLVDVRLLTVALLLIACVVLPAAGLAGDVFSESDATCVEGEDCERSPTPIINVKFGLLGYVANTDIYNDDSFPRSFHYVQGTDMFKGGMMTMSLLALGTAFQGLVLIWGLARRFSVQSSDGARYLGAALVTGPMLLLVGTFVWVFWVHVGSINSTSANIDMPGYFDGRIDPADNLSLGWSSALCIVASFLSVVTSKLVHRFFVENPLPDPGLRAWRKATDKLYAVCCEAPGAGVQQDSASL